MAKGLAGIDVVSVGGDAREAVNRKRVMQGRRGNKDNYGLEASKTCKGWNLKPGVRHWSGANSESTPVQPNTRDSQENGKGRDCEFETHNELNPEICEERNEFIEVHVLVSPVGLNQQAHDGVLSKEKAPRRIQSEVESWMAGHARIIDGHGT